MNVLNVVEDFEEKINYKNMKQFMMMKEGSNAIYAQMKEDLKLKVHCQNTWCFIMNLNTLVQNVVKTFILQHIWKDTKKEKHVKYKYSKQYLSADIYIIDKKQKLYTLDLLVKRKVCFLVNSKAILIFIISFKLVNLMFYKSVHN